MSATRFNRSAAELVIIAPITTRDRGVPLHVRVDPPAGGLKARSFVMCEQLRCISTERLVRRRGQVPPSVLREVADRIRVVLDLDG